MSHKVTNLIKDVGKISYSFEITPGITEEILENLDLEPSFFSITWHAQEHNYTSLDIAPLTLAKYLKNKNRNVLLHISCTNLKKDYAATLLDWLQDNDICNLFIVLGEKYDPDKSDFKSSQELILYVRSRTGSYFCIGVAGFPDRNDKMLHLKEKVESGADFILTQAFFDYNIYKKFVTKCREIDIHIPIIPGLFPFETIKELNGFVKLCDVHLPQNSVQVFNESGIEVIAKLIHKLKEYSHENNFHLFTINKIERSMKIIRKVNLLKD